MEGTEEATECHVLGRTETEGQLDGSTVIQTEVMVAGSRVRWRKVVSSCVLGKFW